MKPADKRTNEAEIRIYQSLWKNILLVALCLAFAVVGYMIIRDDDCGLVKKMLGGWLNIIFFGGGGLFIAAITIHNRIRHIPLLVIYEGLNYTSSAKGGITASILQMWLSSGLSMVLLSK